MVFGGIITKERIFPLEKTPFGRFFNDELENFEIVGCSGEVLSASYVPNPPQPIKETKNKKKKNARLKQ